MRSSRSHRRWNILWENIFVHLDILLVLNKMLKVSRNPDTHFHIKIPWILDSNWLNIVFCNSSKDYTQKRKIKTNTYTWIVLGTFVSPSESWSSNTFMTSHNLTQLSRPPTKEKQLWICINFRRIYNCFSSVELNSKIKTLIYSKSSAKKHSQFSFCKQAYICTNVLTEELVCYKL